MSLIRDPVDSFNLRIARDRRGLETQTAQFWMDIFHREFPASRSLYLIQESHPSEESRCRIDCRVSCWDNTSNSKQDILYVEFKRAGITSTEREAAVHQVSKYCSEHLMSANGPTTLWCMVCYGTKAAWWETRRRTRGQRTCFPPDSLQWTDAGNDPPDVVGTFIRQLESEYGQ
jgi:hypothetical protein